MTDTEILKCVLQTWSMEAPPKESDNKLIEFARAILAAAGKGEPVVWMDERGFVCSNIAKKHEGNGSMDREYWERFATPLYLHPAAPCAKRAEYREQWRLQENDLVAYNKQRAEAAEAKCEELERKLNVEYEHLLCEIELAKAAEARLTTIRNDTLEEAAKVCQGAIPEDSARWLIGKAFADAVRALKEGKK